MAKGKQRSVQEQGRLLARMRLEQMGFRALPSDERGISFYVSTGEGLEPVKVKTIRYGSWQFAADKLMDITVSKDGVQTIHGRKPQADEDMLCIMVRLDEQEFYVLRLGQLYNVICTQYETWMAEHGGRRPRVPGSMHCSASPEDLQAYKDNWQLFRPVSTGKYRGSKEYHLVYSELIRAAQYGGVTTYQAIAQIMNLPLRGSHMGRETGRVLGEISEDELNHGRPMLSAIAVGVSGLPGQGFFAWAEELGRLSPDATEEEKLRFWEEECKAVYRAWKREFKVDK